MTITVAVRRFNVHKVVQTAIADARLEEQQQRQEPNAKPVLRLGVKLHSRLQGFAGISLPFRLRYACMHQGLIARWAYVCVCNDNLFGKLASPLPEEFIINNYVLVWCLYFPAMYSCFSIAC